MVRLVNTAIETKVQVLDSEGDPAAGATVNYIVYDEADASFATGTMSHIANGLYTAQWTPDAAGEWTFEAYSSNPKFRKSFVFWIETASAAVTKFGWKLYNTLTDTRAPPTQNVYHEVFDLADGSKLHYITVEQNNDETDAKNVDIRFTIDGQTYELIGTALAHGEIYYIYWEDIGQDPPAAKLKIRNDSPLTIFGMAAEDSLGAKTPRTALEMHDCKFEYRMTSVPGTNQTLVSKYRKSLLEAV